MGHTTENVVNQASTTKVKKPYESPTLKLYGLVRSLTRGNGSQHSEGNQRML